MGDNILENMGSEGPMPRSIKMVSALVLSGGTIVVLFHLLMTWCILRKSSLMMGSDSIIGGFYSSIYILMTV